MPRRKKKKWPIALIELDEFASKSIRKFWLKHGKNGRAMFGQPVGFLLTTSNQPIDLRVVVMDEAEVQEMNDLILKLKAARKGDG